MINNFTDKTSPPEATGKPTVETTNFPGSACDGTKASMMHHGIKRCCRENGPCMEGEGDCNNDSECASGLKCGSNNCKRDYSTPDTLWRNRHDCCFQLDEPTNTGLCDGTDRKKNRRCCMKNGPCNEGEGHCKNDDECASGLKCGNNNCRRDFSTPDTVWNRKQDCCFGK